LDVHSLTKHAAHTWLLFLFIPPSPNPDDKPSDVCLPPLRVCELAS